MTSKDSNLDWQEQLRRIITTPQQLIPFISLTDEEIKDMEEVIKIYPMSITPYYASLMDKEDKDCPIRRMVLPNKLEIDVKQSLPDLGREGKYQEVAGVRKEFKSRETILTTLMCPNGCRYCFRKYWVGRSNNTLTHEQIDKAVESIKGNREVREISISGGDPLILPDSNVEYVLNKVREIPQVEVVRLYTKMLATLPQRITDGLVGVLKKYPTLYVCTHFNHPKELTPQAAGACRKLVDNGIPVLNQSVLLKGVNDNTETMRELLWGLVKNKVKPFYLQHCIKQTGNDHLVTKIDVGTKIIKDLYCNMSAISIPLYDVILYGGKALMMPDYILRDDSGRKFITNLNGERFNLDDLEV